MKSNGKVKAKVREKLGKILQETVKDDPPGKKLHWKQKRK